MKNDKATLLAGWRQGGFRPALFHSFHRYDLYGRAFDDVADMGGKNCGQRFCHEYGIPLVRGCDGDFRDCGIIYRSHRQHGAQFFVCVVATALGENILTHRAGF